MCSEDWFLRSLAMSVFAICVFRSAPFIARCHFSLRACSRHTAEITQRLSLAHSTSPVGTCVSVGHHPTARRPSAALTPAARGRVMCNVGTGVSDGAREADGVAVVGDPNKEGETQRKRAASGTKSSTDYKPLSPFFPPLPGVKESGGVGDGNITQLVSPAPLLFLRSSQMGSFRRLRVCTSPVCLFVCSNLVSNPCGVLITVKNFKKSTALELRCARIVHACESLLVFVFACPTRPSVLLLGQIGSLSHRQRCTEVSL